jgi:hypothetical protein
VSLGFAGLVTEIDPPAGLGSDTEGLVGDLQYAGEGRIEVGALPDPFGR